MRLVAALAGLGVTGALACAPKLAPLQGMKPLDSDIPSYEISSGSNEIRIKWELTDDGMVMRGEGLVRTAYPDTARVDLAFSGPFGGGVAVVLIGNKPYFPNGASMTHLLPPLPIIWSALGRFANVASNDTTVRVQGDTLRADFGNPVAWRLVGVGRNLQILQRISQGRVVEYAHRKSATEIEYGANKRKLVMKVISQNPVNAFNPRIWNFSE